MKKLSCIHNKTKEIADNQLPFNSQNVVIMENDLSIFLESHNIDYKFKNINLFRNAFVHKSYCTMKNSDFVSGNQACPSDCLPLQEMPYERLEFLGDAILGYTIAKYMYIRYPDQSEGFLTKMRTKIVNGKMLGYLAECIGFPKFAIISKQIEDVNGRANNYKIMEDIFEAFIGALYMDSQDMELTERWIINVIEQHIDMVELIVKKTNYKDMLLSYMQTRYQDVPKYTEMQVNTTNNMQKIFTYIVKDRDGNILGTANGMNKKEAENNCSYEALRYYGEL